MLRVLVLERLAVFVIIRKQGPITIVPCYDYTHEQI